MLLLVMMSRQNVTKIVTKNNVWGVARDALSVFVGCCVWSTRENFSDIF